MNAESRSSAIAAAIILLAAGVVIYFMPTIVLWIGQYSPTLAIIIGCALILSFFLVFWLRGRYQRSKGR